MNINRILLGGNLTRKPELSKTQNKGTSVCKFSVAYNEFQGSEKSTYYFNVVAYGTTADNCGKYLDKGSCVLVEGKLITRSYKAKDGTNKSVTEIIASNVIFISKTKTQQQDESADY
jgi:single-strand DNA-binding protein